MGGTGCVSTRGFTTGTCRSSSSAALTGGMLCCTRTGWRPWRSAVRSNSTSWADFRCKWHRNADHTDSYVYAMVYSVAVDFVTSIKKLTLQNLA